MKKPFFLFFWLLVGAMLFAGGESEKSGQADLADDYPNKPIRFIVGNGAGGAMDAICRRFQPYLEKELGVPLVFDFIEGAGGVIATNVLKKSPADGYTMMIQSSQSIIISKLLLNADYSLDDFEWFHRFNNDPGVIFVRKDAPWNNLDELADYVRTQPAGNVAVSLGQITDPNYLTVKMLNEAYNISLNPVAYSGGGPARLAVVKGEVPVCSINYFGAAALWSELKVLAIQRAQNTVPVLQAAGVKTVNEQTGQNLPDITSSHIIVLPKGFSENYPERANKLSDCLTAAWANPQFLQEIKDSGMEGYIEVIDRKATAAEMKDLETMFRDYADYFKR